MSYWFLLNTILLFIAIWKILSHPFLTLHIIIGAMAFLFYLFNWTRNAVFSTIRSLDHRQKKIKWANISKKILPYHRWIGTSALLFSIIHAVLVVNKFGFYFQSGKFV